MKNKLTILFISFIFFSCEKYPFQGDEIIESMSFEPMGNNQLAEAGTYVSNPVGIYIYMQEFKNETEKEIKADFEVLEGGGSVDQETLFADSEGKMLTRWKLGSDSNHQRLKCTISDTEGKFLSSVQIQATSYFYGNWNTFTQENFTHVTDMVTDSANHRSIMIINKKLQKTTDNSFQGKALNTFNTIFHSIEKDGLGNVYVGSYDGRLYKILDWDLWWQPCSRPIPDYSGEYELSVTHDNTIWISCPEHGLYFSKDGAQSWQNAESGIIENEKLGRIYQLNDSSFITFSTTRGVILLSNDSGYNWSPMNTPHNTSLCYVSERKEIFIFTRDDGFSIYRSTDFGQKYTLIYSGEFSTNNFSQNPTFIKHENFCYLLIPGAEIVKTTDFSHFEKLRTIDVQYHLNIDHLGTIFISGDEGQPSYVLAPPAK